MHAAIGNRFVLYLLTCYYVRIIHIVYNKHVIKFFYGVGSQDITDRFLEIIWVFNRNYRWSAIAAQLPGRTDNEIKNVWHTHLKKRVHEAENQCQASNFQQQKIKLEEYIELSPTSSSIKSSDINSDHAHDQTSDSQLNSPNCEISSVITTDKGDMQVLGRLQEMDNDLWSEIFSGENSGELTVMEAGYKYTSSMNDDIQFWFNVFTRGEELLEF